MGANRTKPVALKNRIVIELITKRYLPFEIPLCVAQRAYNSPQYLYAHEFNVEV